MTSTALAEAAAAADRKQWDEAVSLLASSPETNEVLDKRGWYLSLAKRYDEAVTVFQELRSRRPNDYRPPYMIGFQHYNREKWREAIPWFDEALRHKPDHIKSLWRKAHALDQLGEATSAAKTAGRVLKIWHELPASRQDEDRKLVARASFLLGKQQARRDPAGAIELFTQAAELEPDEPYKHFQLAKVLRRSGRPPEALVQAKRAFQLKSGDPSICVEFAEALVACGRFDEATKILTRVGRQCKGWKAYQAGLLASRLGNAQLAVGLFRSALRDIQVAADERVKKALEEALLKAPQREGRGATCGPSGDRRRDLGSSLEGSGASSRGRVDVVRSDRGFGFLVDEAGVRRHFRLTGRAELRKGQAVAFTPIAAEKGPAARNVHPI